MSLVSPAEKPGATASSSWRTPLSGRLSRLWMRAGATVRRVPRAGRICFLIALVNSAVWGVVVPPFQVPDEISHFGYAQYLAETGKAPPQQPVAPYSPQEQAALDNSFFITVIGHAQMRGIVTRADNQALRAALAKPSPVGLGGATSATNQPPLYFALEAVPYWLSPSHDIFARLALMRLLSALLAASTVLVVFMFMRELFPSTPWTWTVGALVVAFQPMFAFISAGVQADNLLYLTSALSFFLLLRAYRRGLTHRRAVAIGAATGAGLLAKLTFIGLVPGIALGVLLLSWRARPEGLRKSVQMVMTSVVVAAIPVALYVLLNITVWHRGSPLAGGLAGATAKSAGGHAVTLRESLDYTWELYLPRIPFLMHRAFEYSHPPIFTLWWNGTIGHFGWLDYTFPAWVYTLGRYLLFLFVVLAVAGVVRLRHRVRLVLPLFACFAFMTLGVLAEIGYAGVRYYLDTGGPFEQARYLFPMLTLYGLFIVLAARGAGRRWGPALGAALVLLAMTHGLFAETLTISRYYG